MTGHHDQVSPAAIQMEADLTWQQHQPQEGMPWSGRCKQCRPDDVCPRLVWASQVLGGRR